MNLILYSTDYSALFQHIEPAVRGLAPGNRVTFYQDLDGLRQRLKQPRTDMGMAVLKVVTRDELTRILPLRELLCDLRLIVIVPDSEEATVSLAYQLRPRLVFQAMEDWKVFNKVLISLVKRHGREESHAKASHPPTALSDRSKVKVLPFLSPVKGSTGNRGLEENLKRQEQRTDYESTGC